MTLVQEIESLGPGFRVVGDPLVPLPSVIGKVRAFADKLEGEEMVEKVACAIALTMGNLRSKKAAKAALAVVREMVGK